MKKHVDIINFFLIWITLIVAMAWPFELFLFSYIVLGPLHYLTEINWLDKQNYFLKPKDRSVFFWAMVAFVILAGICTFLPQTDSVPFLHSLHDAVFTEAHKPWTSLFKWNYVFLVMSFVMAAAWVFTENWMMRAVTMVFCALCMVFFYKQPAVALLFGVFLPTLIHVFFFTIFFMLHGSLRSKSTWGYVNVGMMFFAVFIIAAWNPAMPFHMSDSVANLTQLSGFDKVNVITNRLFGNLKDGRATPYSQEFLKMQSFIAFAYTYHYLNWFSKTSIIKWHEVSKKKLALSVVLWVASVGLFAVDYRVGFAAGFALSVLHIVLEFPLNYVSMQGIIATALPKRAATMKTAS